MPDEHMAVLKSLAIRPSPTIAPSIEPILSALLDAGYVTRGPDARPPPAQGCNLIEGNRTVVGHRR
jgi:hypothetical protein